MVVLLFRTRRMLVSPLFLDCLVTATQLTPLSPNQRTRGSVWTLTPYFVNHFLQNVTICRWLRLILSVCRGTTWIAIDIKCFGNRMDSLIAFQLSRRIGHASPSCDRVLYVGREIQARSFEYKSWRIHLASGYFFENTIYYSSGTEPESDPDIQLK